MNEQFIPGNWLTDTVEVLLVGAGGTGSRILEQLLCLHRAILAKGHPCGLHVTVVDMDTVSESNIGRQAFYPSDVGSFKSHTLVNRVNMAMGGEYMWRAATDCITEKSDLSRFDLVIGAVDNRKARQSIFKALSKQRRHDRTFWLDFGNRSGDGQVVFGEVYGRDRKPSKSRLPHVGDLYPELLDPSLEQEDDTPSCSLAEALERQELYINQAVSVQGMNILWQLFTRGTIKVHGAFINLDQSTVMPLRVDPDEWARFGYGPKAKRVRKATASAQK